MSLDNSMNTTSKNLMRMNDSHIMDSLDYGVDASAVEVIPEVTEKDNVTLEDMENFEGGEARQQIELEMRSISNKKLQESEKRRLSQLSKK